MKVFVAGGGGAIGASLLPKLVDAGNTVVATANSPREWSRSSGAARSAS